MRGSGLMARHVPVALACHAAVAASLFYDVIQPHLRPPPGVICLPWTAAGADVNSRWATPGSPPPTAGNHCAQQANGTGAAHATGAYCIDSRTRNRTYCRSMPGVPEQVNLQVASPRSVVVGFVTFEAVPPRAPPTVLLRDEGHAARASAGYRTLAGVTHVHRTAKGRTYYMHFVALVNLTCRGRYSYQVRSGGVGAVLSDVFRFRAPYSSADGGATRIALFGDMGVYQWNNMANLHTDTVKDEVMDLIIHAGDHAYNEGDDDERRADGYMQAYEQTIANTPWMPIVRTTASPSPP